MSHNAQHVGRRAPGSNTTQLPRQDALLFAVPAQAVRDGFEDYVPGCAMIEMPGQSPHVVVYFLFGQNLDHRVLPLLRQAPYPPNSDDNAMDIHQGIIISLIDQDMKSPVGNPSGLNRPSARNRPDSCFHLVSRRDVAQGAYTGATVWAHRRQAGQGSATW